jgi:hypothetical protein
VKWKKKLDVHEFEMKENETIIISRNILKILMEVNKRRNLKFFYDYEY